MKLLNFWQWSASDLVSNAMRGILAEYLVACALQLDTAVRVEWDAYDLLMVSGMRIEVKSAAYLQSWHQTKLSPISFNIRSTRSEQDGYQDLKRQGDVYVLCLLHHQDKTSLDPLDVAQWSFYIMSAGVLNQKFPTQKTLRLSSLLKLDPCRANFDEIAACLQKVKR